MKGVKTLRLFYNGKCIKAMLKSKTINIKTSDKILIAKYKFDCSLADLFPEFNEGFEYTFVDEQVDERDVMSINRETVTVMAYDAKPDEYGVLTTEYEVETPVLINAGDIVTRSIYSNELPTKMTFGYNQDSSYSNETIASSLLSVISMNCSKLADGYRMFKDCSNLTSINYDWSQCRLQHHIGMFKNCKSLVDVNFKGLITSDSINMASIFSGCHSLTEINTNSWNTSNVKDMSNAFNTCKNLTLLDVSKFDTSKVTNMQYMFYNCNKLTTLDVSKFDTGNVIDMSRMFANCSNLTSLEVNNWDTGNVTIMVNMFDLCSRLISLDLSNWNVSKVQNMGAMFGTCSSLKELNVSNWKTDSLTKTDWMFNKCLNLQKLDLSSWNVNNVINMVYMLSDCRSLKQLNLSNWNLNKANITDIFSAYSYNGCSNLNNIIMNNSDFNSVNKIIAQLLTRTNDSMGALNISGIDNISKVNIEIAKSKYWNII